MRLFVVPPPLPSALSPSQIEPKKHLEAEVANLLAVNIVQTLGLMLDTVVF